MADNLTPKEEFLLNPVTEHNITDAAVASFETNFKHPLKVTVPITSTQDLHGMPNPYPAGGSINLIPDGADTENGYVAGQYLVTDGTTTANTNYYVSEYFQISENTTYTWSNRVNTSVSPAICFYDENKTFISGININGQYSQTFTSPAGAVYCRSSQTTYTYQEASSVNAAYQLEVGSTATAYRRYSNICPIDGWTDLSVTLLNKNWINAIAANLVPAANSKWKLNSEHGATLETNISGVFGFIFRCIGNQRYYVGLDTPQTTLYYRVAEYSKKPTSYDDASRISTLYESGSATNNDLRATIRTSENAKYVFVGIYRSYGSERKVLTNFFASLADNAFTPYNATTLPITFTDPSTGDPMTVYGGSLTLNEDGSADLVSEYGVYILDGVERKATAFYSSGENHGFTVSGQYAKYITTSVITTWSSHFLPETYMSRGDRGVDNAIYLSTSNGIIKIRADAFDDEDSSVALNNFNSYLAEQYAAGTPVQVMYVLKDNNVQSYHFPNVGQLKAFLGQNNVWSDIGNVDVKYLTQNSETGLEYRGDRALELRRRAMIADSPHIHTTVGSSATGGLASFKSYVKAPVKKIEIPFSPKQDFNGYDRPWPGGGYVQLFNSATTTYGSKIDVDGTLTEDANYFVSDFIPVTAETYYYVSSEMPVVVGYNSSQELLQVIKNSGIGGAFQTPENCAYVRIQNYTEESDASAQASAAGTAYMCAGSEENQWYPYENICPIEGWTGANIFGTTTNIISGDPIKTISNATIDDKKIIPNNFLSIDVYPCPKTTMLYAWRNATGPSTKLGFSNNPNLDFNDYVDDAYIYTNFVPYNNQYSYVYVTKAKNALNPHYSVSVGGFYQSIEKGSKQTIPLTFSQAGDHSFDPIQEGTGDPSPENVRPIHPGLTFTRDDDSVLSIWGGTLTVNADGTSTLEASHQVDTLDGSQAISAANWRAYPESSAWLYNVSAFDVVSGSTVILSNKLSQVSYADLYNGSIGITRVNAGGIYSIGVRVPVDELNTASLVNAYLAENPIQIVYELATPITYTLSVAETNRALEALGLTQHIGPLYGGTITINPDGSADVVSKYRLYSITSSTGKRNYSVISSKGTMAARYNLSAGDVAESVLTNDLIFSNAFISGIGINNQPTYDAWTCSIYSNGTIATFAVPEEDYPTSSDFDNLLDSIGTLYLSYPLATPQTYHFSNLEQLKVWLGENNFWCDISDDITVKYLNRG